MVCIPAFLFVAWGMFCASMYNSNINQRFGTYEPLAFHVEDFDGLQRAKYEFPSDKG